MLFVNMADGSVKGDAEYGYAKHRALSELAEFLYCADNHDFDRHDHHSVDVISLLTAANAILIDSQTHTEYQGTVNVVVDEFTVADVSGANLSQLLEIVDLNHNITAVIVAESVVHAVITTDQDHVPLKIHRE